MNTRPGGGMTPFRSEKDHLVRRRRQSGRTAVPELEGHFHGSSGGRAHWRFAQGHSRCCTRRNCSIWEPMPTSGLTSVRRARPWSAGSGPSFGNS